MNKFKKQSVEVVEEVVVVETTLSNKELIAQAIAKLSPEELALIYPPIERQNFVVRKNWLGRNQVITFVNNKNQRITYNHDEVLTVMLPKLSIMPCWIKREYWSQSTDMPSNVKHLAKVELLDVIDQELSDIQNPDVETSES
jgi:hypothetical protein